MNSSFPLNSQSIEFHAKLPSLSRINTVVFLFLFFEKTQLLREAEERGLGGCFWLNVGFLPLPENPYFFPKRFFCSC